MPTHADTRRDAARRMFEQIERTALADDTLTDKDVMRLTLRKAEEEHALRTRKRFDAQELVRQRFLYPLVDDALAQWLRKQGVRADPFACFRYKGPERGPTQHETAIGPSEKTVRTYFGRIDEAVPAFAGRGSVVLKAATQAPAPDFRFQTPLPFGAAGDALYAGDAEDLARAVHRVAMYVAVGGDVSRGWRYDCGLVLFCASTRPGQVLGELFEQWPEVRERLWRSARVWAAVF